MSRSRRSNGAATQPTDRAGGLWPRPETYRVDVGKESSPYAHGRSLWKSRTGPVLINHSMMPAMIGRPIQGRILKSGRAEEQGEQSHWPTRFEAQMSKQPVGTQRDAQAGGCNKEKEQSQLEEADARVPEKR